MIGLEATLLKQLAQQQLQQQQRQCLQRPPDSHKHHHHKHDARHHHDTASTGPAPDAAATSTDDTKRIRLKCVVLGAAGAGKTSILRRYFSGTFQHQGSRKPTLGADFYSGRVTNPIYKALCYYNSDNSNNNSNNNNNGHDDAETTTAKKDEDSSQQQHLQDNAYERYQQPRWKHVVTTPWMDAIQTQPTVLIQVWDTAGKERYAEHRPSKYTAALGDLFFRHVDAALLVYDVTSSTSFTQLLKWHADLTTRMARLANHHHPTSNNTAGPQQKYYLPFPVIIVGNKMDVLQRDDTAQTMSLRQSVAPKQRDVMGLQGQFRGKDFRYEYRVSAVTQPSPPLLPSCGSTGSTSSCTPSPSSPPSSTSQHRTPPTQHTHDRFLEMSTYMATGETWTSDGSYLHSLLTSEDGSHPDREMVLLWCMRNGLKHYEVSALEGTGIDDAMEELVAQALESRNQQEMREQWTKVAEESDTFHYHNNDHDDDDDDDGMEEDDLKSGKSQRPPQWVQLRRNPSLDLHARYAPHDEQCCRLFRPFPFWFRKNN